MISRSALVIAVLAALSGCEKKSRDNARDKPPAGKASGPAGKQPAQTTAGPTLKIVMQGLGANMARLMGGLWFERWWVVEQEAKKIADHPRASKQELARIKKILGKDMPKFVAQDKVVHDAALRLHKIAGKGDTTAILRELGTIQKGCVDCHATFRKRLRPPAK